VPRRTRRQIAGWDRIVSVVPLDKNSRDVDSPSKPNALVSAARYSEIGFIIPAAIFLGYGLGRLGDYWLHSHWLYLAGVIFGAVVGFAQMIRMASALSRDKSDS
jgi:F0F1-type ATP synthase assembly protein I